MPASPLHAGAAASGGLAAAICMAVAQIIFLATGASPVEALEYGLSLSAIAFGGTYASVFFVGRARRSRRDTPATAAAQV